MSVEVDTDPVVGVTRNLRGKLKKTHEPEGLVEHGIDERQYRGGEPVADGRVGGLVVRVAVTLRQQFQPVALGVLLAEQRRQPLAVRDVLYGGRDDFLGLLERALVVPVRVDDGQQPGHPVVFSHPQRVHGRQVRLRVRPHVARLVARRVGGAARRLARVRPAAGHRHVLRPLHLVVVVAVVASDDVRQQLTSRLAPQRPRLMRRRAVYHRSVQIVSGLVQLRHTVKI